MLNLFSKLFDANEKEIARLKEQVKEIGNLEEKVKELKEKDFAKQTEKFKEQAVGAKPLDDLLVEVFATAREASLRTVGMRHYDTQLMAGIVLSQGKIAEQKTGEGKTLSAVLPLYLHAVTQKNVHLVTVNDYLARRDAGWNGPIFNLLGLSVGVIIQEGKSLIFDPSYSDESHGDERLAHLRPVSRKEAYKCDVVYGTNNEFGFDYLRDNMVGLKEDKVQRGHYFAIVDEVDSVLIDEARTPLIISAPAEEPTEKYYKFSEIIKKLSSDTDYTIDEKTKTANLTEHGVLKVEKILGVPNLYEKDFEVVHHIENALRARTLFLADRDYVVKENQIIIVDEFTGRLMFGRRWSDGLHQAVEAKEGVPIQQESKTLATISFQNYFRMYEKLSGMTGTAATEAEEFYKIYGLEVLSIPTYRPNQRIDYSDVIFKTTRAKYSAIVEHIQEETVKGRPVLVGTTSIEKNEIVSDFLKHKKIPHNLLNAKNHEKEALIIAQAGEPGAVTIATNMAGRGVDIILGGAPPDKTSDKTSKEFLAWKKRNEQVIASGGLHVIGTERHESRRIDNQLRGRSGRLGDPGSSKFYLSLEDDLMRIFGGEKIAGIMTTLQIPENQPIENNFISKALEQAQSKVETFHFDSRKRVVEYDDVANQQHKIVYTLRNKILEEERLKERIVEKLEEETARIVNLTFAESVQGSGSANYERMILMFSEVVPFDDTSQKNLIQTVQNMENQEKTEGFLKKIIHDSYETREKQVGEEVMSRIEKFAYLSAIDNLWVDHLTNLDDLREGVGLRGYGQKDPLVEFKNEAFELFDKLMVNIDATLSRRIFRIVPQMTTQSSIDTEKAQTNIDPTDTTGLVQTPLTREAQRTKEAGQGVKTKIGRNDPCPCGAINPKTGKVYKYKKCGMIGAPWHRG